VGCALNQAPFGKRSPQASASSVVPATPLSLMLPFAPSNQTGLGHPVAWPTLRAPATVAGAHDRASPFRPPCLHTSDRPLSPFRGEGSGSIASQVFVPFVSSKLAANLLIHAPEPPKKVLI
jgi:hypothetical protein